MPERYTALDNLRAALMLLGILLHAACSYVTFPFGDEWPYKDVSAVSPAFDLMTLFIHVFRMPLFFVLAGFFARLLFERRGIDAMLRNRVKRILVPFAVGWCVLYIPTWLAFRYGITPPGPNRLAAAWESLILRNSTMHLWFLNYLLWFYAATALVVWLMPRLAPGIAGMAQSAFRRIAASPARAFLLAVPSIIVLWFMKTGSLDTSMAIIPEAPTLIAYSLFYLFGWMLYGNADLLETFPRFAAAQAILGFLLVPVTLSALLKAGVPPIPKNTPEHLIAIVTGGLTVWLLIFGLTGLFIKYVRHTSHAMNYFADASYWMYLAHLPIVIWMHVLLADWRVSGLVKFAVIVPVTMAALLVSYELLVRRSIIGEYLNGTATKAARPLPTVLRQSAATP